MTPDHPLTVQILEVSRLLRRRFELLLDEAGLGVTPGEARALRQISMAAPLATQARLAEAMSIEPMTLVGFLDRLESRGLVVREASPTDRRAKSVRVTAAAEPLLRRIDDVAAALRAELTAGIPEEDVDTTWRSLERMRLTLTAPARVDA